MVDAEKLGKKRNGLIQYVEKTMVDSQNYLDADAAVGKEEIIGTCNVLKRKIEMIVKITEEIMDLLDDENYIVRELEICGKVERKVESFIVKAMEKTKAKPVVVNVDDQKERKPEMRLPKLNLKPYDGDPLKWKTFIDTFECAVDKRKDLSDVEKMTYLVTLCQGEAELCIQGMSISNENYDTALRMLKERFGDEQILISAHMNKLLNLETTSNFINIKELRSLYNDIEVQIRSLRGIGLEEKRYGPMLAPVIMSKLPQEIKLILTRKFGKEIWAIDKLLYSLREEVEAREKVTLTENEGNETYENFHVNAKCRKESNQRNSFPCVYCEKFNHKSHECVKISKPELRRNFLSKENRCFKCLKQGHQAKTCRSRSMCYSCGGKHHSSICETFQKEKDKENREQSVNNFAGNFSSVLLQTACADIVNGANSKIAGNARIMFDSGSQLTYITPELSKKLNLKSIGTKELCIQTFGNIKTTKSFPLVKFNVKTVEGLVPVEAYVSDISHPISNQNTIKCQQKFLHLEGLDLADPNYDSTLKIDILIGSNFYWEFIKTEGAVHGKSGEPVALRSNLGYVLSGPFKSNERKENTSKAFTSHVLRAVVSEQLTLEKSVDKFWDLETMGVKTTELDINKKADFVKEFENSLKFDENEKCYEASYPFKTEHGVLGDNFNLCKKRLEKLTKTFEKDKELLENYDNVFKEQLNKGIIEIAPIDQEIGKTHYIPHHAVLKPEKATTKMRIVFDASAKVNKGELNSLNDCIEAGPSINTELFEILLRFRAYNVAIIGDIEKAFLQIVLNHKQRDFVRFLWYKDIKKINFENFANNELVEYRMCRILFGINSSPFILNAILRRHIKTAEHDPEFVNKFINALHVDDLTTGENTVLKAMDFITKAKEHMAKASFNLRKFQSNSKELETMIQNEFGEKDNPTVEGKTKVLGVSWDKETDKICFDFEKMKLKFKLNPTKREVLQAIASIFDPLGLINPIVVKFKCFFQKLCIKDLGWDDAIEGDLLKIWQNLVREFDAINEITFNRKYEGCNKIKEVQLHGFSDASENSYGACVYVRIKTKDNEIKTSLVTSKSRVNPVNKLTIPRLELMGLLLMSRLVNNTRKHLSIVYDIEKTVVWTDSSVAFAWTVNSDKSYERFIENRLIEIRNNLNGIELKLIDTKSNPADIVSRGCKPSDLMLNSLWFKGPDFLILPESQWPNFKVGDKFKETCLLVNEEKKIYHGPNLSEIVDIKKFSELQKLLRVTAWVYRYISNLRKKKEERRLDKNNINNKQINNEALVAEELTIDELRKAKSMWLKTVQNNVERKDQPKLFLDEEGLLRLVGRLENAPIPYETKHPTWLPKEHYLTSLIVKNAHKIVLHNGVKDTLTQLRSEYHVQKGRQLVKKLIHECVVCRKYEGKKYDYPESPDLPSSRVEMNCSFSNSGIDYAGPMYVYNVFNNDNQLFKVWIALITCQTSRAVYLDIATDYSGNSCINVLRRFFNRKGIPKLMISDNGSSFTGTDVQNFATSNEMEWKFNLEKAPWFGGFFERMIKSVKRCLLKSIGNKRIKYNELLTVLSEIERVVNNRPLTYVYDDTTEEPLTPNHLMYGKRIGRNMNMTENKNFNEINKNVENILNHFWKRWSSEYLTELRDGQHVKKHKQNDMKGFNVKENDIVLVEDDKRKRYQWRLGRINNVFRGSDGKIRGAEIVVKTAEGTGVLKRPVNKLYPIESNYENVKHDDKQNDTGEPTIKFISDNDVETIP